MLARLVNGLEPHQPPLSSQKMKCSFLGYVHLLMISQAVLWTQTPSATPLQPIKWNAHFWITFNFWWSAGLVDGLEPHPPPVSCQKMKCTYFDYVQLLMIGQAGQWTWTPSTTPLQPKKMKCSFLDYVHFWWSAWLIDELEPHLPPLSTHKNEMLNFRLRSTSDDQPSWSIDSKSICQPSPANKMKCFFLDYVYFWWSARLVDGLEPHLPPFSSQKNEMLTFGLCLLLMISQAGLWTQTPSINPLQPKKWNTHFWITFNFWCWPHWSMDSNPIHHPSPAKKMKCSFFDYVQLLMISWAGQWT